ncbi:MAG: hypothetical protein AAF939_05475 [Planctomycetota bacterium]
MQSDSKEQRRIWWLRLGTFLCFAGWTWQHLYWEGPYGELLWHDSTFQFAEWIGISWDRFIGDGNQPGIIQIWIARTGWLFVGFSVVSLTASKQSKIQLASLIFGSTMLAVIAYARYLQSQYELPMLIEHGGQVLMPVILVLAIQLGSRHWATVTAAIVAFVMTFAGHGSYAVGIWPTPANFFGMTNVLLGLEYESAKLFLLTVGVLDFAICVGLMSPWRAGCLLYGGLWGFLTAAARPAAGMSTGLYYWGADQFLHEAILRAPHFVIPIFIWSVLRPDSVTQGNDSTVG